MLQTIHRYRKTLIGFVGLGLVVIMMAGFGLDFLNTKQTVAAITVNDTEISGQEFYAQKRRVEDSYRAMFGPSYEKFAENLNINQRVIDQMIAGILIKEFASGLSMASSIKDVSTSVARLGIFQKGFDEATYSAFLSQLGMSAREFESKIKDDVISEQFTELLNDVAFVSRKEIEVGALESATKFDIAYVEFDPQVYVSKVKDPSAEELEQFYNDTATQYEIPKRIKYDYVALEPKDFADSLQVHPEDIEIYYVDHPNKFKEPEQVKVRQIQFLFPRDKKGEIDQKKKGEIRGLADKLAGRLSAGEDFETLARQYTDDLASKANGGDLGWVVKGQLSPEIDQQVFKLKNGGISEVIVSTYAFHIVKVESYKPATTKPLDLVRDEISKTLLAEQAPAFVSEKAQVLLDQWRKSKLSLADFSVQNSLVATSTSKLLLASEDPQDTLRGLTKKVLEFPSVTQQVVELDDKSVLVEVKEFRESELQGLNEVKEKVLNAYKQSKSSEQALKTANEALSGFAKGIYTDLSSMAKTLNLNIKELKDNQKSGARKEILADPSLSNDIFSAKKVGERLSKVYQINGKAYLVELRAIRLPEKSEIEAQLATGRSQKARELGFELASAVINRLKAGATVDVNQNVM